MDNPLLILFRQTAGNRYTVPLLANLIEETAIRKRVTLHMADSLEEVSRQLTTSSRTVVVYSFMTPEIPEIWEEIKALRSFSRDHRFLLAGGPHPTGAPEMTLNMGFDAVVAGAGEVAFPEICRDLLLDMESHRGKILRSGAMGTIDGALPISELVDFIPPLEIMRGCTNACRFCQTGHRQKPVFRSLESIRYFLQRLADGRKATIPKFICPSGLEFGSTSRGTPDLDRVEQLLSLATDPKLGLSKPEFGIFPSELHPRTVTATGLKIIRKYCRNRDLTIGAQSGSNRLLKKLARPHTIEEIEEVAALATEHGFGVNIDFIIGFPDETDEDRKVTIDWIERLNKRFGTYIRVYYFFPLAGTPLYRRTPSLPDDEARQRLEALYEKGICTIWWKNSMTRSWRIVQTAQQLDPSLP